jgi:hypothetical protein
MFPHSHDKLALLARYDPSCLGAMLRMALPCAATLVAAVWLPSQALGASARVSFGVNTLEFASQNNSEAGLLRYLVGDLPIVSAVDVSGVSPGAKQRLFDFSGCTPVTEDTFVGRQVTWKRALAAGTVVQEAVLHSDSLELRWHFDLRGVTGSAQVNVFVPEAALSISPYKATLQDGRVEQSELWVEQRAPVPNLRALQVTTRAHTLSFELGARSGWQFEDVRRSAQHRGLYRLTLPLALNGSLREDISLRISVDEPDATLAPLDLSRAANMGLADEREGDRKGGWTDQGDNDLRTFPVGVQYLRGIPFHVLDPATNGGKAAVMLHGTERPYFPTEVSVPVKRPAAALYFLHGCAWGVSGTALSYVVAYADGSTERIPVRTYREIGDWSWGARDMGENAKVAWRGESGHGIHSIMALRWANPYPEKPIDHLLLHGGDGPVAGVLAITASSRLLPFASLAQPRAPLPPLAIAGAGHIFLDWVFRVTRLDPAYKAADLATETNLSRFDLFVVAENIPAARAEQVGARVREGAGLLVFGPPPATLSNLLPVAVAARPVLRSPVQHDRVTGTTGKPFFLRPALAGHLVFLGLDASELPPASAFYQVQVHGQAQVLAEWRAPDGECFPALVEAAAGKGRVLYLNIPRLNSASGPDGTSFFFVANRYRDPLFLKLAYYTAGRDDVARTIGDFFRAKAARQALQSPLYGAYPRCENLNALAGYLGDAQSAGRAPALLASLRQAEATIDAGDRALEKFAPADAIHAYTDAGKAVAALGVELDTAEDSFREKLARTQGLTPISLRSGPPLLVGSTHVNQGLYYRKGPNRKWLYDWALRGMHDELGWNLFDFTEWDYGGFGIRPDHPEPDGFDDIAQSAQEHGMRFILCTVSGRVGAPDQSGLPALPRGTVNFTAEANRSRAEAFHVIIPHFDRLTSCYGFEPNNEATLGVYPKSMFGYNPVTLGDFRQWLVKRYGSLAQVNAALGTSLVSAEEVDPPRPEEMAQVGAEGPRRALWAEWILFRFELREAYHKNDYEAIRAETRKPIIDRSAGDGMNWCGVAGSGALSASRLDRLALWHDALGTHVVAPFLLDYQAGMARGKRLTQSEYYWSTYGGRSDGLKYRFGGNFMHPYVENERRNFAAVGRNFWKAVSRGNDLFTLYFAMPGSDDSYDKDYWGPCCAYWGDFSFKGMTYAMKYVPQEVNRIRGELLGAEHEAQVGILEPLASVVHTFGTSVGEDVRDVQYEAESLLRDLLEAHVQTDIVGEWRLREPQGRGLPQILVVPYGVYLDRDTQDRLAAWVQTGGILVATGPAGLYDELGKRSGKLLQAAFPGLEVGRGDGHTVRLAGVGGAEVARRWSFARASASVRYEGGDAAVISAPLGRGRMIVTGFSYLDARDAIQPILLGQVAATSPPTVDADNPRVQLYVARRGDTRLLYAINEEYRESEPVLLRFRNHWRLADLRAGVDLGYRSSLPLTLLPGEGRVLRLSP